MYAKKLELDGYDYLTAGNGEEGLKLAQEKLPDLILCDVMMPIKDGISILKDLKADVQTKSIPVIILSNLSKQEYVDEAMELGAVSYLIKSKVLPSEVMKKLKEILTASGAEPLVNN